MEKKDFEFEMYKPDPQNPGMLLFDRRATYEETANALIDYLKKQPCPPQFGPEHAKYSAYDMCDYVGASCWGSGQNKNDQIPANRCVFSFMLRGSSEGYYFHISALDQTAKYISIITAKTLCNESIAIQLNTLINQFVLNS